MYIRNYITHGPKNQYIFSNKRKKLFLSVFSRSFLIFSVTDNEFELKTKNRTEARSSALGPTLFFMFLIF